MKIQDLRDQGLMLFDVISGSRAYGTHKPTSDTDHRGVYILPIDNILGFDYIEQIADDKNDAVYYELGRFLQLLQQQNPNVIELLNIPEENIIYKHPLFDMILEHRDKFISKVCRHSFGGYAIEQIKKARGLKKKIVNPMEKERKTILDFCYVIIGHGTIPLPEYMKSSGYNQGRFGLVNISHAKDLYAMFYDQYKGDGNVEVADNYSYKLGYRGIMNDDETSNEVRLSSIPKGETSIGVMIYNKDAYTLYCKEYKEYWDWAEKRNPERYQTNIDHGKNYDSKNMLHCVRLLRMAREIATLKQVIVRRPDAEELMKIRNGEMEYSVLLENAEKDLKDLDELYAKCDLPSHVDKVFTNKILIDFRRKFYEISGLY